MFHFNLGKEYKENWEQFPPEHMYLLLDAARTGYLLMRWVVRQGGSCEARAVSATCNTCLEIWEKNKKNGMRQVIYCLLLY